MKSIYTFILLFLSHLTYFGQTSCADTLIIGSDADAALGFHDNTTAATTNYGTAAQSAAYLIPGSAGPLNGNRAVMHFDLSSIPVTATITAASLNLFAFYPLGSYPGHVGPNNASYLQRVTSPWTESAVTWSTQPTVTTVNQASLSGTSTYSLDYLNINVTNLIKDIFSAANNYGFLFRLANEQTTNILAFCSRDHANPAKRPVLTVYYNTCLTGINETTKNKSLYNIYPNPSNGMLTIETKANYLGISTYEITNTLGQIVQASTLKELKTQLSIENYNPGIYFIKINNDGNSQIIKFVKE